MCVPQEGVQLVTSGAGLQVDGNLRADGRCQLNQRL